MGSVCAHSVPTTLCPACGTRNPGKAVHTEAVACTPPHAFSQGSQPVWAGPPGETRENEQEMARCGSLPEQTTG